MVIINAFCDRGHLSGVVVSALIYHVKVGVSSPAGGAPVTLLQKQVTGSCWNWTNKELGKVLTTSLSNEHYFYGGIRFLDVLLSYMTG